MALVNAFSSLSIAAPAKAAGLGFKKAVAAFVPAPAARVSAAPAFNVVAVRLPRRAFPIVAAPAESAAAVLARRRADRLMGSLGVSAMSRHRARGSIRRRIASVRSPSRNSRARRPCSGLGSGSFSRVVG